MQFWSSAMNRTWPLNIVFTRVDVFEADRSAIPFLPDSCAPPLRHRRPGR